MQLAHRPAQTMLEMVIAIGIIIVSVYTATTLIVTTIGAGGASQNRIEAANIAREGIEVVRQIRDANWLRRSQNVTDFSGAIYAWDLNPLYASNAPGTDKFLTGNYWISYVAPSASTMYHMWTLRRCNSPCTVTNLPLRYSQTQQVYTQGPCANCENTRFFRLITITKVTDTSITLGTVQYLDVVSYVQWQEKNRTRSLTAQERLYDWQ